jgi:Tfp pilus assembly protein FimV
MAKKSKTKVVKAAKAEPKAKRHYKKIDAESLLAAAAKLQAAGQKVTITAVAKACKYKTPSVFQFVKRMGLDLKSGKDVQVGTTKVSKDGVQSQWKRASGTNGKITRTHNGEAAPEPVAALMVEYVAAASQGKGTAEVGARSFAFHGSDFNISASW